MDNTTHPTEEMTATQMMFQMMMDQNRKPEVATPPPPKSGGGSRDMLMGIVVAIAGYFLLQSFDKSDSTNSKVPEMAAQLTSFETSITKLENSVSKLSTDLQTARVDPFTGSMGVAMRNESMAENRNLERRIQEEIDTLEDKLEDDMSDLATRLREVESRQAQ